MNSEALVTMLCVQLPVIAITVYFFYRVLTTPPKAEPDSFSDNEGGKVESDDVIDNMK